MGDVPHLRERDKQYWVVSKTRMFKLLLKHDRVDTQKLSVLSDLLQRCIFTTVL